MRFDESARLFTELGDEHNSLQATRRLAWTYEELGDLERARALNENILRRARATHDAYMEAQSLGVLAQYALEEGRIDESVISMLKETHSIHRERPDHPNRYWDAITVCRFARALALAGRVAPAAQLLSSSEALLEELGVHVDTWLAKMNQETLTRVRAHLDEASIAEAWERGRALTADEAVALALDSLDRPA